MLSPRHGPTLVNPISKFLKSCGANAIIPPEAHGIGVEHFGRQFRIPAISLGWFDTSGTDDNRMRRLRIDGLSLETHLRLVTRDPNASVALSSFWSFAHDFVSSSQK